MEPTYGATDSPTPFDIGQVVNPMERQVKTVFTLETKPDGGTIMVALKGCPMYAKGGELKTGIDNIFTIARSMLETSSGNIERINRTDQRSWFQSLGLTESNLVN